MASAHPVISIVVPALCRPEVLRRFLAAAAAQTYDHAALELVVVDDGSPVPLAGVFEEHRAACGLRTYQLLRNGSSRGRAASRNAGLALTSGEVVLFIDVDNLLAADACERLSAYFTGAGPHGAVRANIASSQQATARSAYARFFNSRYLGQRSGRELAGIDPNDLPKRYFATDAIALSRSVLARIGGFDEQFTDYGCEDEEMGVRLHAAGEPLRLGLDWRVVDNDTPTLRRACQRMVVYAARSVPRLLAKHPPYAREAMFSLLEQAPASLAPATRLKRWVLLGLCRPALGAVVLRWLERGDGTRLSIPGALYKYALAAHYIKGMRERSTQPSA